MTARIFPLVALTGGLLLAAWPGRVSCGEVSKEYRLPGIVALQTARQHGWGVRVRNSLVAGGSCRWRGDTLIARSPAYCWVQLFTPPRADCGTLRADWRIRRITLAGEPVSWLTPSRDTNKGPRFSIRVDSGEARVRVAVVSLSGPAGTGIAFQRAFDHCDR